jgi:hypothetical protein
VSRFSRFSRFLIFVAETPRFVCSDIGAQFVARNLGTYAAHARVTAALSLLIVWRAHQQWPGDS